MLDFQRHTARTRCTVQCYAGAHQQHLLLGVLAPAVYPFGMPVLVSWFVRRPRVCGPNPRVFARMRAVVEGADSASLDQIDLFAQ